MTHCTLVGIGLFMLGILVGAGATMIAVLRQPRKPPDPGPIPEFESTAAERDDMYRLSKSDRQFFEKMAGDTKGDRHDPG